MGVAGFPPCWLFGLRRPSTGAFPGLFGGANGGLWEGSHQGVLPRTSAASVLVPWWATGALHLCRRPSNTSRLVWFSLLWGHCSFPLVPMRTLLCVCPPRVESLFPPVLLKSCNQIPLAFKVWFSRNSSSCCQTPRLGSLTCGSEPSLQWVDFCGISVLQFVSHPPSSYGIWFYCDSAPPTVSLRPLLCLCTLGIFFGEFQCLPVGDSSVVSCDSRVFERGSESISFYSAILNRSKDVHLKSLFSIPLPLFFIFKDQDFLYRLNTWTMDSTR